MKKENIVLLVFLLLAAIVLAILFITKNDDKTSKKETEKTVLLSGKHYVEISVKKYGKINLELDADIAPITVTNFIKLVNNKFYDGLTFHRIMEGFMIQGGGFDESGNVKKANTIKGEFSSNGYTNTLSHKRGIISMARANDKNSASSQFFIMQEDNDYLDGNYAAFGYVTSGMDVVDKIAKTAKPTDNNGSIKLSERPVIEYIKVIVK